MSELDRIRAITNNEPAPELAEAPPMVCPACGELTADDGSCVNVQCSEYNSH